MFVVVEVLEENRYQIDQQLLITVLNKRGREVVKLFLFHILLPYELQMVNTKFVKKKIVLLIEIL